LQVFYDKAIVVELWNFMPIQDLPMDYWWDVGTLGIGNRDNECRRS